MIITVDRIIVMVVAIVFGSQLIKRILIQRMGVFFFFSGESTIRTGRQTGLPVTTIQ